MTDTAQHESAEAQHESAAVDRLEAGVAALRLSEPSADLERNLLRAAVALPVIGLILIGLAWYGASGTGYVADQIPYLISGGLIGLGLVLIGLGLFLRFSLTKLFRFWLARLVYEHQTQTDRMVDAMAKVEAAIRHTSNSTQ